MLSRAYDEDDDVHEKKINTGISIQGFTRRYATIYNPPQR